MVKTIKENLLVQFSIAAFLVLMLMFAATSWAMSRSFEGLVLEQAASDAVAASNRLVLNMLTAQDLREPMSGQRYEEFDNYVRANIVSDRTARIKVWDNRGRVVYSTDRAQVGQVAFPVEEDLALALGGKVERDLMRPEDAEDESDRVLGTLVEVYAPIRLDGAAEISGAFETYQFWSPYAMQLDRLNNRLFWAVGIGGSLLYASLFLIVRRGWHTILRQRRVEKERRTLESIMASMGEGLVVADAEGTVVYCNPAAEKMLQIAAADIIGKPAKVYHQLLVSRIVEPEDWRRQISAEFDGNARPGKVRVTVQTGRRREIEGTLFTVEADGRRLGTGAVLRDITREREVDRMKSEFVSIASHELRTPMTAVFGFSELLLSKAKELEDRHRSWVQMIHDESKRLSDMIEEMLSASRIEGGGISLSVEPIDIKKLTVAVLEQLGPGSPRHTLSLEAEESLPSILCDKEKLQQVLHNLVGNAVKYSPNGGPVVVAARSDVDSGCVVISVADCGLGVPEEEIPRLFTKFHRVHRKETADIRGTGLGLYIVKSMVEMMGGRIQVESKVGKGSVFRVYLPSTPAVRQD